MKYNVMMLVGVPNECIVKGESHWRMQWDSDRCSSGLTSKVRERSTSSSGSWNLASGSLQRYIVRRVKIAMDRIVA